MSEMHGTSLMAQGATITRLSGSRLEKVGQLQTIYERDITLDCRSLQITGFLFQRRNRLIPTHTLSATTSSVKKPRAVLNTTKDLNDL